MYKAGEFQTPVEVAEYMVDMIPTGAKKVLEPTPGIGNIVGVLKARDKYDIYAPEDWFLLENSKYDCIVMNPPFSAKYANLTNAPEDYTKHGMRLGYHILQECMEMSNSVIALMPWFTVSDSDVRLRFLKSWGIKSITALPRKTFQYARIQTCVLEMQKGYTGDSLFKTL